MLVADIAYSTSDLDINLLDASYGDPTGWAWKIEDATGTPLYEVATQNGGYTFDTSGIYTITLEVTKTDEEPSTVTISVKVDVDNSIILYDANVIYIVKNIVPPAVFTAKIEQIMSLKYKWQELLWEALSINFGDIHYEDAWPAMANLLIGYLIARDLIIAEAGGILLQTSSAGGGTKKIVTGPTEAEKFQAADTYKEMFGDDGAYTQFTIQICSIANRLRVYISGCDNPFLGPIKVYYTGDYSYEHKYITDAPEFVYHHNHD